MSIKIYKRPSGIWHLRGTVQKQRIDQSARTRSRSEAEAIRAKIEAELFKQSVYGTKSVAVFSEAVIDYLNGGGSPDHLSPLVREIGDVRLSNLNQAAVDKLARSMKPNAAPATLVRQIYTPVSAVLNHAARSGICEPVRFKRPRIATRRTEYLTPRQADDWLEALPPHMVGLVSFYLATGCRATEALTLQWKDVTLGERRAVFWQTKAGYARGVDIPRRARETLSERPDIAETPVFLNSRGEPWHAYDAINLTLKKVELRRRQDIAKGANKPPLVPAHCHLFRHTWATWAYAATKDMTYLMAAGGWRSATMVMRYAHAASNELGQAVLDAGWEFSGKELYSGLRASTKATA